MSKTPRLADLKPAPYNPRDIGPEELDALKVSLGEFGDISGIVWNERTGHLVTGHQRFRSLQERYGDRLKMRRGVIEADGLKFVVRVVDWDEAKERAANVAANSPFIAGHFTDDLEPLLGELLLDMPDLSEVLRFEDLRDEFDFQGSDETTEQDEIPETPTKAITKRGDFWVLGEHRIMCGDSTRLDDVKATIAGNRIGTVVADPPYGMSYTGATFGTKGVQMNDTEEAFEETLAGAVAVASNLFNDITLAIFFGTSRLDAYFRATRSLAFHRLLTIYKPNGVAHPWRGWILTSEVIGLFSLGKPDWPAPSDHCHDVYTFDYSERPDRTVDHPTVKPLSIVADVISKIVRDDEAVFDPFLGSGTTLIAAEQLDRRCFGIELDPVCCDVIVERWENFSGGKARKAS